MRPAIGAFVSQRQARPRSARLRGRRVWVNKGANPRGSLTRDARAHLVLGTSASPGHTIVAQSWVRTFSLRSGSKRSWRSRLTIIV